jgi:hypothetical protein
LRGSLQENWRIAQMGSRRFVNNMLSVFDLEIAETSDASRRISARVVFEYNRGTGLRSFRILSPGIPGSVASGLIAWLEKNVDPEDIELGFESRMLIAENPATPSPAHEHPGERNSA